MKILFTASTMAHIRNFHIPYILWLKEQGHVIHVAAGEDGLCPEADAVMPLPLKKSMTAPKNIIVAWSLHNLIKHEQYDIISCHTSLASFFTRLSVCRRHRPIVINTSHGYLFDEQSSYIKRTILLGAEKCMAHRTDMLMVMNEQDYIIAKHECLSPGAIIKTNGMGIDLKKFSPCTPEIKEKIRRDLGITSETLLLIYIAEFSIRKNQRFLIQAMKGLPSDVHILLLGNGKEFSYCKILAEKLKFSERIHFLGYQSNTLPYLHAADIAVSSSRYEGLPFNLMEAMAVGLPLIVSDVKGNQDLVVVGENGFTYPYDNQEKFISCIRDIANRDRIEMGDRSVKMVPPYGLTQVLAQIVPYYTHF